MSDFRKRWLPIILEVIRLIAAALAGAGSAAAI